MKKIAYNLILGAVMLLGTSAAQAQNTVTVHYPDGGKIVQEMTDGAGVDLHFTPHDGWDLNTVLRDNEDITHLVGNDGHYVDNTPLTASTDIEFTVQKNEHGPSTGAEEVVATTEIKVFAIDGAIRIDGAEEGLNATVCNLAGQIVYAGTDRLISVNHSEIYLVRIGDWTFKVFVK